MVPHGFSSGIVSLLNRIQVTVAIPHPAAADSLLGLL